MIIKRNDLEACGDDECCCPVCGSKEVYALDECGHEWECGACPPGMYDSWDDDPI